MNESILNSIKSMLGLSVEDTSFDIELVIFINSAIMRLNQLTYLPAFSIDNTTTWKDYIGENISIESIKEYIYISTRLTFDPPNTSFVSSAFDEKLKKLEYVLSVQAADVSSGSTPTPSPTDVYHNATIGLDYDRSGHTGFQRELTVEQLIALDEIFDKISEDQALALIEAHNTSKTAHDDIRKLILELADEYITQTQLDEAISSHNDSIEAHDVLFNSKEDAIVLQPIVNSEMVIGLNTVHNHIYVATEPLTTINIKSTSGIGMIRFTASEISVINLPSGTDWDGAIKPTFETGLYYQVMYAYGTFYSDGGR